MKQGINEKDLRATFLQGGDHIRRMMEMPIAGMRTSPRDQDMVERFVKGVSIQEVAVFWCITASYARRRLRYLASLKVFQCWLEGYDTRVRLPDVLAVKASDAIVHHEMHTTTWLELPNWKVIAQQVGLNFEPQQ